MTSPSTSRPASLDCCEFHATGGAMGEAHSDTPCIEGLFSFEAMEAAEHTTPVSHPGNWPGASETDKATLAAERNNRGRIFRGYHSVCRSCGAIKSRGSVRVGVKKNPMRCPSCEPVAYAREHGLNTPGVDEFLNARKPAPVQTEETGAPAQRVRFDPPSIAELTILCALHHLGGSAKVSTLDLAYHPTVKLYQALIAKRLAGYSRRPGERTLVITERGRSVMRAALTLCLITPA